MLYEMSRKKSTFHVFFCLHWEGVSCLEGRGTCNLYLALPSRFHSRHKMTSCMMQGVIQLQLTVEGKDKHISREFGQQDWTSRRCKRCSWRKSKKREIDEKDNKIKDEKDSFDQRSFGLPNTSSRTLSFVSYPVCFSLSESLSMLFFLVCLVSFNPCTHVTLFSFPLESVLQTWTFLSRFSRKWDDEEEEEEYTYPLQEYTEDRPKLRLDTWFYRCVSSRTFLSLQSFLRIEFLECYRFHFCLHSLFQGCQEREIRWLRLRVTHIQVPLTLMLSRMEKGVMMMMTMKVMVKKTEMQQRKLTTKRG